MGYPTSKIAAISVADDVDEVLAAHVNNLYTEYRAMYDDAIRSRMMTKLDNQMGDPFSLNNGVLAISSAIIVQPPAGETWCIQAISASKIYTLQVYDGVSTFAIAESVPINEPVVGPFYITNSHYIRLLNTEAVAGAYSYQGFKVDDNAGNCITEVIAGITDSYGVSAIKPAEGEEWVITTLTNQAAWTDGEGEVTMVNTSALGTARGHVKLRLTYDLWLDSGQGCTGETAYLGYVLIPEPA